MSKGILLSRKEEERLLKLQRQVFLEAFANPTRRGCPTGVFIERMAAGRVAAAEENEWIDHFASCSPCSREFSEFRRKFRRRRRIQLISGSALAILAFCAALWLAAIRHGRVSLSPNVPTTPAGGVFQQEVLDLRDWSAVRSDEERAEVEGKHLELHRGKLILSVYLPTGSQPGKYELAIIQKRNQPLLKLAGTAQVVEGRTILDVHLDLSRFRAGEFELGIRQPPWDWRYYPVTLR